MRGSEYAQKIAMSVRHTHAKMARAAGKAENCSSGRNAENGQFWGVLRKLAEGLEEVLETAFREAAAGLRTVS